MTGFYLQATRTMNGQMVELKVARGTRAHHEWLGAITLERVEWEGFRIIVIAGMRAAGYAHIPVELMDQTRTDPNVIQH